MGAGGIQTTTITPSSSYNLKSGRKGPLKILFVCFCCWCTLFETHTHTLHFPREVTIIMFHFSISENKCCILLLIMCYSLFASLVKLIAVSDNLLSRNTTCSCFCSTIMFVFVAGFEKARVDISLKSVKIQPVISHLRPFPAFWNDVGTNMSRP